MKYLKLNQVGETIIEVMMSAAILGAVISASFVIVRRSLDDGQAASERTQALKIAESQLERVKYLATQEDSGVFDPNRGPFCVAVDPNSGDMSLVAYNAADESYKNCDFGSFPESNMVVRIDYVAEGLDDTNDYDNNYFKVTIEWDRVGGGGRENLELSYRLHPPAEVSAAPTPVVSVCPVSGLPIPPGGVADCTITCPDGSTLPYNGTCPVPPPVDCGGEPYIPLFEARFGFTNSNAPGSNGQPNNDPYLVREGRPYTHESYPDFDITSAVDGAGRPVRLNPSACDYTIGWKQFCSAGGIDVARLSSTCGSTNIGYDQIAEAARIEFFEGFSGGTYTPGDWRSKCDDSTKIAYTDTFDRIGVGSSDGDGEVRDLSPARPGVRGAPAWSGFGNITFVPPYSSSGGTYTVRCVRLISLCYANPSAAICTATGNPVDPNRQTIPLLNNSGIPVSAYWVWYRPRVNIGANSSVWIDSILFGATEK